MMLFHYLYFNIKNKKKLEYICNKLYKTINLAKIHNI